MNPWKDCLNFSDAVLDAFIERLSSHPDHPMAVAESERRRRQCKEQGPVPADHAGAVLLAKAALIRLTSGTVSLLRFSKLRLGAY